MKTSIPVRLPEETSGTQPLPVHFFKDSILFPQQCVYCGAPKAKEITFNVTKRIERPGGAGVVHYRYQVAAPYCERHARQSRRFDRLYSITFFIGALVIGLPLFFATTMQASKMLQSLGWMGGATAFILGGIVMLAAGALTAWVLKFVLVPFMPALKDHHDALGISVEIAEPTEQAELNTFTLDFTFTSKEFASAFQSLNQLSPEEIASIRDQLEAAELAKAASAEKAAAEANTARVEALIRILGDDRQQKDARRNAAGALAKIGDTKAVEPLIKALKDEDYVLVAVAARALVHFVDKGAIDPLIEVLQTKPAKYALARQEAAKGLGLLGGEKSVNALISALESSEYPLRPVAASALGDTQDPRALEALRQVLNDPHKELKENAKEAIEKIEAQADLARDQE